VTGGGSGGHITPILAVANELKKLQPQLKIVYIGQRGESLLDIPSKDPNIDEVFTVSAGKFRRYSGEGWKQLFALPTQLKNIRDAGRVVVGIWQSFWLLRKLKPEIIFTRGGFVSVPVAFGAVLNRIPYITHDSDSVPSLANRIIARWASLHAVALPVEFYPYPRTKTKVVGIPLSSEYEPVTPTLQEHYKKELKLEQYKQVVLVTGGGNGADQLNEAVIANANYLLKQYPHVVLMHFAGRALESTVTKAYDQGLSESDRQRVIVLGFVTNFYCYSGAADVIVARGGATNLAEFALQGKPCIIVPASQLVGSHQVKNAEALAKQQAIVMLNKAQSEQENRLAHVIGELLDDESKRSQLSHNLAAFAHGDAAKELAMLLLERTKQ
jgi:UDP-N-acetylglucosamine--N-acetylmuramyl-(pentapeptide) pyrophosphoryl-undecaprenol N-acetylglucosamine transferase